MLTGEQIRHVVNLRPDTGFEHPIAHGRFLLRVLKRSTDHQWMVVVYTGDLRFVAALGAGALLPGALHMAIDDITHAETICRWTGAGDHLAWLRGVRAELEAILTEAA